MAVHLDEAEKQILGALLIDFTERMLDAQALSNGYEGPKVTDLTEAICCGDDITTVDFDIAFADLEKKKLIRTGPWKAYENSPGASFIMIGGYSLKLYASLTQLGYKTSRQTPNKPSKSQRIVNNVHISGGQFNNLQLATGESISQKMDVTTGEESEILSKLVAILETQGQTVSIEQRADLLSAIDQAKEGNGKEARSLLEKVCGPVWHSVQPVMWPIVGDLVRQSLGL
ncbi:hypothetical protein [Pseudomonas sp. MN1F]|uniref:hypothetical protein n=1 Tax=Pseudomonas sp. MN1F TaxID=1366632 RepID=UPI00128EA343|nr:hypothetical protein [Pseudomonas sp. MN1F]MQG93111.1 hypothetical protein [Pseudomonas sp. MN1F]